MSQKNGKPQMSHPGRGWFTVEQVSEFLDISRQSFHGHYRKHVPESAMRCDGKGRPTWVHGRTLHDALVAVAREQERERFGDDGLLIGEGSPSLERLRAARAKMVELDLRERQGQLLDVQAMNKALNHYAVLIRQCGQQLRKEFGNGAGDLLDATADEFAEQLEKFFSDLAAGKGGENGGGDA